MSTHKQLSLFESDTFIDLSSGIVNVSSVPQRSPFRYAGGKTWLVPTIRKWLAEKAHKRLIEPFCGGGTVALTAIDEHLATSVMMIEKDEDVAAVWEVILNDSEWLIERILTFEMNRENVLALLSHEPVTVKERAFATIIKNRTNHGGILAKGVGTIKRGENGKGISSRWYPSTLAKRIRNIVRNKANIEFVHGDAFDFMKPDYYDVNTYYFIDPPYTIAGKRLYTHCDIEHEALFKIVSEMPCHYLMTYDKCDYVISLAEKYNFHWKVIPMQTTKHVKKEEIIISDSFDWFE